MNYFPFFSDIYSYFLIFTSILHIFKSFSQSMPIEKPDTYTSSMSYTRLMFELVTIHGHVNSNSNCFIYRNISGVILFSAGGGVTSGFSSIL